MHDIEDFPFVHTCPLRQILSFAVPSSALCIRVGVLGVRREIYRSVCLLFFAKVMKVRILLVLSSFPTEGKRLSEIRR
jgi:hypothetical protein